MKPAPQTASQNHDIARRLEYLGLDEAALKRLRTLKPFIVWAVVGGTQRFATSSSVKPRARRTSRIRVII